MKENGKMALKKIHLGEISEGSFFPEAVYLDKKFVLADAEMPVSNSMIRALSEWEFTDVFLYGEGADFAADGLEEIQEAGLEEAAVTSDADKMRKAEEFYSLYLEYMDSIFKIIKADKKIEYESVVEKIKPACDIIKESGRFLLRVHRSDFENTDGNYLAFHSVKTMIISIMIGFHLKLPQQRLIELGVSALLHDIGMKKLPSHFYLSQRTLEPFERQAVTGHPILGYNMLKALHYPLQITLGILEHHERENGSGYPRKLMGDKITLYAKIIGVACSYEALSSQRQHKNAKDGYTGMLELLKNEGRQYDDTIVRALVYSLSIYPIGLHVLLSNGLKAQVIDVNPEKPKFPIVQVYGKLTPDGRNEELQTSSDGVSITRPLTREEIEPK